MRGRLIYMRVNPALKNKTAKNAKNSQQNRNKLNTDKNRAYFGINFAAWVRRLFPTEDQITNNIERTCTSKVANIVIQRACPASHNNELPCQ